jgi:hypothetical protein
MFAEEFVHMTLPTESPIWKLLGLMVVVYVHRTEFTQQIIKPLTIALSMYLSAEYKRQSLPENRILTDFFQMGATFFFMEFTGSVSFFILVFQRNFGNCIRWPTAFLAIACLGQWMKNSPIC